MTKISKRSTKSTTKSAGVKSNKSSFDKHEVIKRYREKTAGLKGDELATAQAEVVADAIIESQEDLVTREYFDLKIEHIDMKFELLQKDLLIKIPAVMTVWLGIAVAIIKLSQYL